MAVHVVIMGAPGAGKGTQAERMRKLFELEHVSTGEILRKEVAKGSELGQKAKSFLDRGGLVPDDLVVDLIGDMIREGTSKKGFLFDGFPRSCEQAKSLDKILERLGERIGSVVNLEVPEEVLKKRIMGRKEKEGNRSDDNEKVVAARLEVYRKQTQPLIDYYDEQQKLVSVDGNQDIDSVFKDIQEAMERRL